MKLEPEIWQEYDCPDSGIDSDIDEADIVAVGEQFYCSGCGKHHKATLEFPENTYVRLSRDGGLEYRRTPRDAAEKDAWRAEVAAERTMTQNEELTGAAPALSAEHPATEGSEVERRVGGAVSPAPTFENRKD